MVLDFDANIVIAVLVCVSVILCVKYVLSFILNIKRINASKKLAEALDKCAGNDFDKDKQKVKGE